MMKNGKMFAAFIGGANKRRMISNFGMNEQQIAGYVR